MQPHFVIEANKTASVLLLLKLARCIYKLGLKISQNFNIEDSGSIPSPTPQFFSFLLLSYCPHLAFLPSGLVMTDDRHRDH